MRSEREQKRKRRVGFLPPGELPYVPALAGVVVGGTLVREPQRFFLVVEVDFPAHSGNRGDDNKHTLVTPSWPGQYREKTHTPPPKWLCCTMHV